ncbi:hypothetical protein ASZ78_014272 [Callipepla squamata]|uniref:carbonyl reductase (NADPH) n=1 Tax=Callipepla squamata TaxID=9009 RepID=A0A226NLR2_CALSU|nr:hypothetical protein ASZ78_014272 [Callipepla squamata]
MSSVAVVTGSNKGIGLAIVRDLCKQFQGDVYLTSRDPGRGQEAVAKLREEGLHPLFHQLDIDDLQSIRALRDFLKEKYGGLNVLINNAGIAFKGRVVNVSSMVSISALGNCSQELQKKFRSDTITEDELVELMTKFVQDTKKSVHDKEGWPNTAYGVSKIGVTVLSRIQARILNEKRKGDHILLNACCPGWVRTDMAGPKATKSPEEGADTPVYLALLPSNADGPHGQFVSDRTVRTW